MIEFLRRHLVQIVTFTRKEIRQVVRQPGLIVLLIVGPFLVLGIFGVGYRSRPGPLKTVMVLPAGSELANRVPDLQDALEPSIDLVDVTADEADARRRLIDGEVDVVVVAPPDAIDTVRSGEHAEIMVLHDRLDPFDRAYISIFSRASIDELNRTLLEDVMRAGKERLSQYDDALPAATSAAGSFHDALASGDRVAAAQAKARLIRSLTILEEQASVTGDLVAGVERGLGVDPGANPVPALRDARTEAEAIDPEDPEAATRAAELESALSGLQAGLSELQGLPPAVVVRPFVADPEPVVGGDIPMTTYYAPGVLVVLIQHIAVTFAALAIVRERQLGTADIFRVAPLRTFDIVLGKYLGYLLMTAVVGAALTTGVVFGFGLPLGAGWWWSAAALGLVTVASLGLGFVIAGWASTDAQAIQFSMLTLLFTFFFSGFVLSLDRIASFVRPIAYAVPSTAGIRALHDVMFRGRAPEPTLLLVLGGYAVVALIASILVFRRRLTH